MLTIPELIKMFLNMKQPNTRRSYLTAIKQIEMRCGPLTQITPSAAMEYFSELKASDISASTLRQRFNVLTSLYNYLVDMQVIERNPLRPVARAISWRQAAQVRPTALVDFALVHKILRAPLANTKKGIRDRAIMALFFGSGLRRTEALNLKIESIAS